MALCVCAAAAGADLEELITYLPFFAPKLDALGPHLMLLRPHIDRLLPVLPKVIIASKQAAAEQQDAPTCSTPTHIVIAASKQRRNSKTRPHAAHPRILL